MALSEHRRTRKRQRFRGGDSPATKAGRCVSLKYDLSRLSQNVSEVEGLLMVGPLNQAVKVLWKPQGDFRGVVSSDD